VAAVASLAAPVRLAGLLLRLLPALKHVARWHRPGDDVDLWDQEAVEELYSYGLRATSAINELNRFCAFVRDELAQVRSPVLVLHGGRDRTVDPACADEIAQRLVCSASVEKHLFPRSGHALSVDVDRERVNTMVEAWFERFTDAAEPADAEAAAG